MTLPIVLFSGIGDHVLWLSLLPEFRRAHGQRISAIVSTSMVEVAHLFPDSYDELTVRTLSDPTIQALQARQPLRQGDPMLCWHPRYIGDELDYLSRRPGTIADAIRDIMALPRDAAMARPAWSMEERIAAEDRMTAADLPPGRTVLLAPSSHSWPTPMPDQWWSDAVAHLRSHGLTVAMNVANRGRGFDHSRHPGTLEALPGTVPVDVPLSEIGPFAELCGYALVARAGLADLLATVPARLCVVWGRNLIAHPRHSGLREAWGVERVYGRPVMEIEPEAGAAFEPGQLGGWLDG